MTDVVCCIVHYKIKRTPVHYDVTTFCDVCETANGLRLLSYTSTLRSGEVEDGGWVVVDSEYHHQSDGISVRDEFEDLLHQLFYDVILLLAEIIFELMKNN